MQDFNTPRTYIVSAFIPGLSAEGNERRHASLVSDLTKVGFPFRECEGSYKGAWERSVAVIGTNAGEFVRLCAVDYLQESFLVITENDRTAYFVNPLTEYHTHGGRFVAHGKTKPETEGWTLCDGTYYVINPTNGPDLPGGL